MWWIIGCVVLYLFVFGDRDTLGRVDDTKEMDDD